MIVALLALLACRGAGPDEGASPLSTGSDTAFSGSVDTSDSIVLDTVATDSAGLDTSAGDTAALCPPPGPNRRIEGIIELSSGAWEAKIEGSTMSDQFGTVVGAPGDVTGDGLADLLVNAPLEVIGSESRGLNYLIPGPVSGLVQAASAGVRILDATPGYGGDHWSAVEDMFSSAGDVDGDGITDMILANHDKESLGGGVYILGGLSGVSPGGSVSLATAHATVTYPALLNLFGVSHAFTDFTGDGMADLAVGEQWSTDEDLLIGRVWIFEGPVVGEIEAEEGTAYAEIRGPGRAAGGFPGWFSVSMDKGDMNGDGVPDLLVGSWSVEGAARDSGGVHVFFGPLPSGVLEADIADKVLLGDAAGQYFGLHQAVLGDTNGDGYEDFAAGAGTGTYGYGSASTYLLQGPIAAGPPELVSAVADAQYHGTDTADEAWYPYRGGDLDGDGLGELLVGAWQVGPRTEGAVHVLYGALPLGTHVLEQVADATIFGEAPSDKTFAATSPGDMNGDCMDDLVVGSQDNEGSAGLEAGAVYLLLGGTY